MLKPRPLGNVDAGLLPALGRFGEGGEDGRLTKEAKIGNAEGCELPGDQSRRALASRSVLNDPP